MPRGTRHGESPGWDVKVTKSAKESSIEAKSAEEGSRSVAKQGTAGVQRPMFILPSRV